MRCCGCSDDGSEPRVQIAAVGPNTCEACVAAVGPTMDGPIPDVDRHSKCRNAEFFTIIFDPIACSFCSLRRDGLLTDHGRISFSLCVSDQRRKPIEAVCHFCVGRQQEEGQDRSEVDGQQCGHQRC